MDGLVRVFFRDQMFVACCLCARITRVAYMCYTCSSHPRASPHVIRVQGTGERNGAMRRARP
eukprot:3449-Eustigmatos_ZCMA.PRE.1